MKHIHTLNILTATLIAAATGCSSPDYDEYYVKYTVGITPGDTVNIKYNDVYHSYREITGIKDSETIEATQGPLYGGFRVSIEAAINNDMAPRFIQIDMSKNGSPYRTVEFVIREQTASWIIPITH